MNSQERLNLARKWRPRSFDEVVGQPVAVSMLRNSLYKNHFFPVYLFSGQRGCGKTSSARIFAAAANCEKLADFQKDPSKQPLPCLTCQSCTHVKRSNHPDFVEIDAASHTGVDDVRSLLESCNFMPIMGSKKLYLIDEAHMLSKAAFNALLKMLEEPPPTVVFMLATTELEKIPDTVRSRCFHLSFSSLETTSLQKHLATICSQENIAYEDEALALIVHETGGSARDALNLLEQVRFSGEKISSDLVRTSLGMLSPLKLAHILDACLKKDSATVIELFNSYGLAQCSAQRLWALTLTFIRELLWKTYGTMACPTLDLLPQETVQDLLKQSSQGRLHAIMQLMWNQEVIFLATPYKHQCIESLYLQICEQINTAELSELKELLKKKIGSRPAAPPSAPRSTHLPPVKEQHQPTAAPPQTQPRAATTTQWSSFIAEVATLNDPILNSILTQATYVDAQAPAVSIQLRQASSFFIDKLSEQREALAPLLSKHFSGCSQLTYNATHTKISKPQPRNVTSARPPDQEQRRPVATQNNASHFARKARKPQATLAVSSLPQGEALMLTDENEAEWPLAALLHQHFPGKLSIIKTNGDTSIS